MLKTYGLLGLSSLAATLAVATPAAAQNGEAAQASNDSTEIVCRRLAAPTGSRLGRRNVCKTQAEWEAEQAQYRQEVQRQQDLSHQSFGNDGG